jgi:DUF971 family protein
VNSPRKIETQKDGALVINWDDGHRSFFRPLPLRAACKCAHCEDEWTGARRLDTGSIPEDIRILEIKPVGRYGLQFAWSDGHGTGIYTFERLRELCDCSECGAAARG